MDVLFPGRFSILTTVHEDIIKHILDKYIDEGKLYIGLRIVVDEKFTNYNNPFTFQEREKMFNLVFNEEIAKGKICVVPLRYGLDIKKDMNAFCGRIIAVYTREKMWARGCKILNVPTIYENREGFSATNVKQGVYEILRMQDRLPELMDGIDDKILKYINNNEEILCRLKKFAIHRNGKGDKFGLNYKIKRIMKRG